VKSSAYREMADAEYVLRFLTLHSCWQRFTGSLRRSMDQFMADHRTPSERELRGLRVLFERSIRGCQALWGDAAFKRPVADAWRHQMLAGMYDAQMLAVSALSEKQLRRLTGSTADVLESTRQMFNEDPTFEEAVRRGTNTPSRIVYRVEKMRDLLVALS